MKPNFALDLSHDGIRLLFRGKGGWQLVGAVALDDPQMSEHLADLRQKAETLAGGEFTSKLVIPNSQILYTTLDAPGPDDIAREVQIRVALEGMTPYAVSDLVFDWRAEGDTARVAVLARETMEEAEGFAAQFGFNPISYVARPESGAFSGEPFFGKTNFAAQVMSNGDRLVPDTSPIPKSPKHLVIEDPTGTTQEPRTDTEPPKAQPTEPASTATTSAGLSAFPDVPAEPPEQTPTETAAAQQPADAPDEPDAPSVNIPDEAPETSAPDASTSADALNNADKSSDTRSEPAAPKPGTGESAPSKAPKLSAPKRGQADTSATPILAPFPPTPEDEADAKGSSTPRHVVRATPDAPSPAAPKPKMGSSLPPLPVATEPAAPKAKPSSETADKPAFSSRRQAPEVGEPPTPDASPATTEQPEPAASPPSSPAAPALAPAHKPVLIDDEQLSAPKLLGEAEKRRLAMARALGLEAEEEKKPGVMSRFGTGLRSANEKRRANAEQRNADKQAKAAATPTEPKPVLAPVPDTPPPAPSDKKSRGRFALPTRKDKPKPAAAADPREKEAEAMTVFGARKGQSNTRGRSSFSTGLTLTLLLILLLAGLALWSSYFLGDDDVALFNPETPTPETTQNVEVPATEPETQPQEPVDAQAPEPLDVLTPEQAAEIYATTGVYQRAPETPADPQASSDQDVYVASIDPSVSPNDALALPDPNAVALEAPASPQPPPPPGTTFDLDENGLVIPTPDGAVSPSGVIVTQGRPSVVPAPRPENLVPEAEVQEDAALSPDQQGDPGPSPRARPENLTELAERARLGGQSLAELAQSRPRARPDDLDVAVAVASAAAAEPQAPEDEQTPAVDEAALASATELAVAASVRPSSKPSNFGQLVARAETRARDRAPADDGSQVIAASAATTRAAIPTSASVARSATMKNALNLRKINLIGVYGSNSSRRALVRLGSGRYVKVSVGDRLDGGRVTAISASQLVYQKGNRQFQLQVLPLG